MNTIIDIYSKDLHFNITIFEEDAIISTVFLRHFWQSTLISLWRTKFGKYT